MQLEPGPSHPSFSCSLSRSSCLSACCSMSLGLFLSRPLKSCPREGGARGGRRKGPRRSRRSRLESRPCHRQPAASPLGRVWGVWNQAWNQALPVYVPRPRSTEPPRSGITARGCRRAERRVGPKTVLASWPGHIPRALEEKKRGRSIGSSGLLAPMPGPPRLGANPSSSVQALVRLAGRLALSAATHDTSTRDGHRRSPLLRARPFPRAPRPPHLFRLYQHATWPWCF